MKATYLLCQLFVSGISYQERNAGTYGVSVGGGGACFKNKSRIILIYFYPFLSTWGNIHYSMCLLIQELTAQKFLSTSYFVMTVHLLVEQKRPRTRMGKNRRKACIHGRAWCFLSVCLDSTLPLIQGWTSQRRWQVQTRSLLIIPPNFCNNWLTAK